MDTTALGALARSNVYGLLAMSFRYPMPDSFELIKDGTLVQDLLNNLAVSTPEAAEEFEAHLLGLPGMEVDLSTLENEYLQAFQTNAPSPSVSLYEGSYAQGAQKAQILLEIRGFYEHFGLEVDSAERELEDSLAAELEFMQFLAAKQSQAYDEGHAPDPYVLAQRDFLSRHLAAWLPRFEARVASKVDSAFYKTLAAVARGHVERDLKAMQQLAPATPAA